MSRLFKALGVFLIILLFASGAFWMASVFTYSKLVAVVSSGADRAVDEAKDEAYGRALQSSADLIVEEQPSSEGKYSSARAIDAARKRQLGFLGFLAVLWAKFTDLGQGRKVEPRLLDPCDFQAKPIGPLGQSQPTRVCVDLDDGRD